MNRRGNDGEITIHVIRLLEDKRLIVLEVFKGYLKKIKYKIKKLKKRNNSTWVVKIFRFFIKQSVNFDLDFVVSKSAETNFLTSFISYNNFIYNNTYVHNEKHTIT